jgi:hypothetical protein
MFPIAKPALSFGEIADYWTREIHPPASWEEILRTLESAWWLGELRGNSGVVDKKPVEGFLLGRAKSLEKLLFGRN